MNRADVTIRIRFCNRILN